MASFQANLSRDGHTYTKTNGLVAGLPTYGVVKPERKIRQGQEKEVWEAIVIGSGYAGLIAARDLVKAGEPSQMNPASCHLMLTEQRNRQEDTADRGARPCWWANMDRAS